MRFYLVGVEFLFTLWPFMVSGKEHWALEPDEPGLIPFLALRL